MPEQKEPPHAYSGARQPRPAPRGNAEDLRASYKAFIEDLIDEAEQILEGDPSLWWKRTYRYCHRLRQATDKYFEHAPPEMREMREHFRESLGQILETLHGELAEKP